MLLIQAVLSKGVPSIIRPPRSICPRGPSASRGAIVVELSRSFLYCRIHVFNPWCSCLHDVRCLPGVVLVQGSGRSSRGCQCGSGEDGSRFSEEPWSAWSLGLCSIRASIASLVALTASCGTSPIAMRTRNRRVTNSTRYNCTYSYGVCQASCMVCHSGMETKRNIGTSYLCLAES